MTINPSTAFQAICLFVVGTITVFADDATTEQKVIPALNAVTSQADLDKLITSTTDPVLKQAYVDHTDAILVAAKQYPHVQAVIRTIESAPGRFKKINTTPDSLKAAIGGEVAIFDTLIEVSTSIQGGRAHNHRKESEDPYNAAFIEHLGAITSLETLYLEATAIEDSMVAPVLKLKNLKSLSIYGFDGLGDASLNQLQHLTTACPKLTYLELAAFAKATDAGWEKMAGLTNLEHFSVVGFRARGHCFAKFKGWAKLKNINFHANLLDDEGLGYVCENFPNLEFIKLWHSGMLTDAAAEHFKKLKKLKGIEISCEKATTALVKDLSELPMEYVALEYGVNAPLSDAIAMVKAIPTLRRLQIDVGTIQDDELKSLAGVKQLERLSLSNLPLADDRIEQLKSFAFVREISFTDYKNRYPEDVRSKVKSALPGIEVRFVP